MPEIYLFCIQMSECHVIADLVNKKNHGRFSCRQVKLDYMTLWIQIFKIIFNSKYGNILAYMMYCAWLGCFNFFTKFCCLFLITAYLWIFFQSFVSLQPILKTLIVFFTIFYPKYHFFYWKFSTFFLFISKALNSKTLIQRISLTI